MKKLLVTGASGFLGWHICHHAQKEWEITGTWNSNKRGLKKGIRNFQVDLTKKKLTLKILGSIKPDAILHLAAQSSTGFCENYPELSFLINYQVTKTLTEFSIESKIPFLFVSSGQVFDGLKEEYHELDIPNPQNVYGQHKFLSEQFILQNYPEAIICRVPVMYGFGGNHHRNFMKEWLMKWKKDQSVTAFHDEIRSFLSGRNAAEGLFLLLNKVEKGIFHIGGKDPMSRVDFAKMIRRLFQVTRGSLIEKSQREIKFAAYRPPQVVFKNLKVRDLGFETQSIEHELAILTQQSNWGI